MTARAATLEADVNTFIREAGLFANVRVASEKEVEALSDVWDCTHAVFLDDNVALGVVDEDAHELWWYVYTFIDGEWTSHNDTGEDRTFLEALADAVSMLFYMRTHHLKPGIIE